MHASVQERTDEFAKYLQIHTQMCCTHPETRTLCVNTDSPVLLVLPWENKHQEQRWTKLATARVLEDAGRQTL